MDAKILEKIAKLKAHAESAKNIGSEAEAEAFATMMQTLLIKHKLSLTDLEYANYEKDDPVGTHRIDYTKYPEFKVKHSRVAWAESLASIVAEAHFCKILVAPRSNKLWLVGREQDAQIAEYMIMTLTRNVEKIADKAYVKYFYACRDQGRVEDARGYRASFLKGFVSRLRVRYQEELKREESTTSTALIRLTGAMTVVNEFIKKNYTQSASAVRGREGYNGDGYRDGRAAADKVNLKPNAVGGSVPRGQLR